VALLECPDVVNETLQRLIESARDDGRRRWRWRRS
jgi:hypothetical protein